VLPRRAADDVGKFVGLPVNSQVFSAAGYVTLMINRRRLDRLWTKVHG